MSRSAVAGSVRPESRATSIAFPGPRPPKDLPAPHRPREKLLRRGPESLSASELVAVVLGSGNRTAGVERLAGSLLRRRGLRALASLTPSDWLAHRGLGPATAARLCAAFELGRRVHGGGPEDRPRVNRPHRAWAHVRGIGRARKEHLVGLYLDAQNGLIRRETLSVGSLNTTRTHPREILYPAIEHLAAGFVLAHNHPSGCLDVSPEDVEFTRAVRRAGELMGIELYDHLIVAGDRFVSLRERGVL